MRKLLAITGLVLVGFLLLAGPAFALAQQPAPAAAGAAAGVNLPMGGNIWKGILNGAVAGAVAVFYGFAKNRDAKTGVMESFDIKYAFPTIIVGALVGVVAALLKMTPDDLATSLSTSPVYGAIVFAVEALLKAVFRHSVPWVRDALDAIKGNKANPTLPAPESTPAPSPKP